MEFSKVLKASRLKHEISQQALADRLHVTRQTVSIWENEQSYPDLDTLVELSKLLDVSLDTLIKGEQQMVKQISQDVRSNKRNRVIILIMSGVLVLGIALLALLGYGRANQVAIIDRMNPFLKTEVGYATLPTKTSMKTERVLVNKDGHQKWVKKNVSQPVDAYVASDSFGNGSWLKFLVGEYGKDNHFALVEHKGAYVYQARPLSQSQLSPLVKATIGTTYHRYDSKVEGPRSGTNGWWPFN